MSKIMEITGSKNFTVTKLSLWESKMMTKYYNFYATRLNKYIWIVLPDISSSSVTVADSENFICLYSRHFQLALDLLKRRIKYYNSNDRLHFQNNESINKDGNFLESAAVTLDEEISGRTILLIQTCSIKFIILCNHFLILFHLRKKEAYFRKKVISSAIPLVC